MVMAIKKGKKDQKKEEPTHKPDKNAVEGLSIQVRTPKACMRGETDLTPSAGDKANV